MALIYCSECGKKVSEKAESCPNCGNPIYKEMVKYKTKKKWEDLTPEDKKKIVAYRKQKKEWWDSPARLLGLMILGIGVTLAILGFVVGMNTPIILTGMAITFVGDIISFSTISENKEWYEKNIDRLYEDKVI